MGPSTSTLDFSSSTSLPRLSQSPMPEIPCDESAAESCSLCDSPCWKPLEEALQRTHAQPVSYADVQMWHARVEARAFDSKGWQQNGPYCAVTRLILQSALPAKGDDLMSCHNHLHACISCMQGTGQAHDANGAAGQMQVLLKLFS